MHNKLFIMDNAVGLVGGRNIADSYFGVRTDQNYRDLDVLAAGPIVSALSASFDAFWNSEWAIPIVAVVKKAPSEQDLQDMRKQLEDAVATAGYPYPIQNTVADLEARLIRFRDRFIWAPGTVLVEPPRRSSARRRGVTSLRHSAND
jgi:putative cardiolipin synthase